MDTYLSPEFISVCQAVARHISTKLRNLIILRLAEFLDLGTCQGTFLSNVQAAHYNWKA